MPICLPLPLFPIFLTLFCMKGFFIKKAFFDGWDNLIAICLINIAYLGLIYLGFIVFMGVPSLSALAIPVLLLVISIFMGASASAVHNYSDYKGDTWSALRYGLVRNIRHSLFFALLLILAVLNIILIIPFYLSYGNAFGILISVVLLWIELILLLCLPYYFPLMNHLPADRPLKTAKKCFIIVGDNFGFTIFFFLYNIVCAAMSVFTMGIIPGITGMQLAAEDAIRLMMMKYDYLEENPDADRKHIPWEDILYDEKEKVGPRSLKNMIFPWK